MSISVHGIFFALGAIVWAGTYYGLLKDSVKIKPDQAFFDTAIILFFGLLGARLAYVLLHGGGSLITYLEFWHIGLISFGGIILGSFAMWWHFRRRPHALLFFDAFSLAGLLAWSVGRLGNFLAKDAYGVIASTYGAYFYQRVPIQLYESFLLLIVFGLGLRLAARQSRPGWAFWYSLFSYGSVRLLVDFWRDLPPLVWVLNLSQVVALILIICGMIGLLWQRNKQP